MITARYIGLGSPDNVWITEWNEFRSLDLNKLLSRMKGNVMVDLRNIYDPEKMKATGFAYSSVGRPDSAFGSSA